MITIILKRTLYVSIILFLLFTNVGALTAYSQDEVQDTNSNYAENIVIDAKTTPNGQDIKYAITQTFIKPSRGIFLAIPYIQDGVFYRYQINEVTKETKNSTIKSSEKYEQAISHDEFRVRIGDINNFLPTGTYTYFIAISAITSTPQDSKLQHIFTYINNWTETVKNISLSLDNQTICTLSDTSNDSSNNCSLSPARLTANLNPTSSNTPFGLWRIPIIQSILPVLIVLLSSIAGFLYFYIKYARDPTSPVPTNKPEFEPPKDLYPWESQFLIEGITSKDTLLSYILWLNHKKYISIEPNDTKPKESIIDAIFGSSADRMILTILQPLPTDILPEYFNETIEKINSEGLKKGLESSHFTTKASDLSEYFYTRLKPLYTHIRNNTLLAVIIVHCVTSIIFLIVISVIHNWVFVGDNTKILLLVLYIIPIPFEIALYILWPKLSLAGADLRAYCQRYKYYLSYVEKFKLDFSNNPESGVQFYLKSVPAAAAFGILTQFNKYITSLLPVDTENSVSTVSLFTPIYISTFDSVFTSSSSSGVGGVGGGSSGGGGSW